MQIARWLPLGHFRSGAQLGHSRRLRGNTDSPSTQALPHIRKTGCRSPAGLEIDVHVRRAWLRTGASRLMMCRQTLKACNLPSVTGQVAGQVAWQVGSIDWLSARILSLGAVGVRAMASLRIRNAAGRHGDRGSDEKALGCAGVEAAKLADGDGELRGQVLKRRLSTTRRKPGILMDVHSVPLGDR
jgi:hypothetical protein